MKSDYQDIPVLLFAYARPHHLLQTLESLKNNHPPEIIAFCDGPRTEEKIPLVSEVRKILHSIDWCKTTIYEREVNLGLGRSILSGVDFILNTYPAVIVFEDDLVCAPGTYDFLSEALRKYWDEPEVMSVTGWIHPSVTPQNINGNPYFDGRAECWSWATWKRAWNGMHEDALTLMNKCKQKGIDINKYGYDLPKMARLEKKMGIWAVRFLYHHMNNNGLCLRPPFSLVDNIGFDEMATNTKDSGQWESPGIKKLNMNNIVWPELVEDPECARLWRAAYPHVSLMTRAKLRFLRMLRKRLFKTITQPEIKVE